MQCHICSHFLIVVIFCVLSAPNVYTENEQVAKYEIMDGAPVRGIILFVCLSVCLSAVCVCMYVCLAIVCSVYIFIYVHHVQVYVLMAHVSVGMARKQDVGSISIYTAISSQGSKILPSKIHRSVYRACPSLQ